MQASTSATSSSTASSGEEEEEPSSSSMVTKISRTSSSLPPPLVPDDQPSKGEKAQKAKKKARVTITNEGDSKKDTEKNVEAASEVKRSADSVELQWFREQWRKELKKDNTDTNNMPTPEDAKERSVAPSVQPEQEAVVQSKGSIQRESSLLRFRERGRVRAKPLPFAVPSNEPLQCLPISEPAPNVLHISAIPDEVLVYIFCFTDPRTIGKLCFTCKKVYLLTREPILWRIMCFQLFGEERCKLAVCRKYRSWWHMFLTRPRLRFDGLFVSSNRYLRPGSTEWTYNQPVHEVIYYRYFRFFEDGLVLYSMALEGLSKVLRWFHPNIGHDQTSTKDGRDGHKTNASTSGSSSSSGGGGVHLFGGGAGGAQANHPLRGTYQLDDVSGVLNVWVQGKANSTLTFTLNVGCRQAGRMIGLSLTAYSSISKQGTTTQYSPETVAPFVFQKVASELLDPPPPTYIGQ